MEKRKVVVTLRAPTEARALFDYVLGDVASVIYLQDALPEQRGEFLRSATALFSGNFPQEVLPQEFPMLGNVKFIQLVSAGADSMPFAALGPNTIIAGNVGAFAAPMAEHVMAMTLALAKRLVAQDMKMMKGEFDQTTPNRLLSGMTAGIVGFGGIGRATARLMRPFGMSIYAINTSGRSDEPTDFIGTLRDLEKVLKASDVVVLSLPLTKATRCLIGRRELEMMKPNAILVNVARGSIIDEEALYDHLKSHPDFMAGIDTWWTEPRHQGEFRMDHPFLELPNVLGSPHNSGSVPSVLVGAARRAGENVRSFLTGEKVIGVMRREDYV
ncbi:MAG: 2-hydroxyacid dehydrogenase [Conexivisphaerales archaeon]